MAMAIMTATNAVMVKQRCHNETDDINSDYGSNGVKKVVRMVIMPMITATMMRDTLVATTRITVTLLMVAPTTTVTTMAMVTMIHHNKTLYQN